MADWGGDRLETLHVAAHEPRRRAARATRCACVRMRTFRLPAAAMNLTRIALVTAAAARDQDEDLPPLVAALRELGIEPAVVDWDDAGLDWARFDVAVLRSTWDYSMRAAEFLAWAARVSERTRLLNPPEIVRWNTDKHYLATLAAAGVPIVPSTFIEPGTDARRALEE